MQQSLRGNILIERTEGNMQNLYLVSPMYHVNGNDAYHQSMLQPLAANVLGQPLTSSKVADASTATLLSNKFLNPNTCFIAPGNILDMGMKLKCDGSMTRVQMKPNTSKHFHIFVGDLCPNLLENHLKEAFAAFGEISDYKIIQDTQTGKSKGYGFVTFVKKEDAEKAISRMNGQWLGSRTIRTNWATRKISSLNGRTNITFEEVYNQTGPSNCTVYCGGIMTDLTEELIRSTFTVFGDIEEIRIFKEKGYAFIRFGSKEVATSAIVAMNLAEINGHTVKCSWGKKSDDSLPSGLCSPRPALCTPINILGSPHINPAYYTSLPCTQPQYNQLGYCVLPETVYPNVYDCGLSPPLVQLPNYAYNACSGTPIHFPTGTASAPTQVRQEQGIIYLQPV